MKDTSSPKNLLFITGTRADYGKLERLALTAHKHGFSVTFFVTGMHMFDQYGLTKCEVHARKEFLVTEFINQRPGDPLDIILAKTILGFSDYIQQETPDLVIVHGDRIESLAISLVCATNYIKCAHVEGGEVSGTIDEIFRHCNTKLAWTHLVSSDLAKSRVCRLGEHPERIYNIGSPELDIHGLPTGLPLSEVKNRYDISFDKFGICIFHPVTSEIDTLTDQANSLYSALEQTDKPFIVILPNNDPGTEGLIEIINRLPKSQFRVLPSMRFLYFSELLRNSSCIIGNSSVGVREAPFLGVPSLNIGTRQTNRAVSESVVHATAFDVSSITKFIDDYWDVKFPRNSAFGIGQSSDLFLSIIQDENFWRQSFQKYFVDKLT